mmetsp:Transcript_837/g.1512  ORF Transcript_837/g.1512 Transcript_837/m.1512 type:complete len:200 (-) Transcript_837:556-1155(-)
MALVATVAAACRRRPRQTSRDRSPWTSGKQPLFSLPMPPSLRKFSATSCRRSHRLNKLFARLEQEPREPAQPLRGLTQPFRLQHQEMQAPCQQRSSLPEGAKLPQGRCSQPVASPQSLTAGCQTSPQTHGQPLQCPCRLPRLPLRTPVRRSCETCKKCLRLEARWLPRPSGMSTMAAARPLHQKHPQCCCFQAPSQLWK